MIAPPNIQPLSDFQLHTEEHLRQLKETGMPEVLTINGKAELVVQSAETYQALVDRLDLFESARQIEKGLEDYRAGRVITLDEFKHKMRAKIGKLGSAPDV